MARGSFCTCEPCVVCAAGPREGSGGALIISISHSQMHGYWRALQNALTRLAGGMRTKTAAPAVRVVVDMREFMSSLPAVLYQQVRIKTCIPDLLDQQLHAWSRPGISSAAHL